MEKYKILTFTITLIIFQLFQSFSFSAQRTWNGSSNTAWENPNNWTPQGVPTNADLVYIPRDPVSGRFPVIISGSFEANKLFVWDGATVIMTGGQLTVVSGSEFILETGSPGGIFNQSGGTLILRDIIIRLGSVFNQTGGSIEISRDWFNDGTFNSTGGTVQFTSNASTAAYYDNGINQFYNVIIDQSVDPGFDNDINSVLYIKGDFTNNNTALDFSTNVNFIFNGTINQSILSQSTFSTFGNLEINKNSSVVSLSSNLKISGNCTVTSGTFNTGSYTFQKSSAGGSIAINEGAEIIIGGTNSFPSNFSTHIIDSESIVEYNGTNQSVSNESYGTLKICGSGVKIMPAGMSIVNHLYLNNTPSISLGSNLTINDSLTFVSGNLILGSYSITIGSTAVISGYSSSSYVTADGNGYLKINNVGSYARVFPVGLSTSYNPVTIINYGITDNFSVKIKNGFDNQPVDSSKVVRRQWTIIEDIPGGSSANLSFQFSESDWASGFNINDPVMVGKWNGSAWVGYLAEVTGINPYVITSLEQVTGFSPFGVGNEGSLPVEISYFYSNTNGRNVTLFWETVSEINNSGFAVLRKNSNGNEWKEIGFVNGYGTTNEPKKYSFKDDRLNSGSYFYRLKQIDFNGNFEFFTLSNEVFIKEPGEFSLSQNYPNPSNPLSKIEFSIPIDSKVKLVIYDITGKETASLADGYFEKGYYTIDFDGTNLASGIYFYVFEAGGFKLTKRIVLIK
ncbi:MAG TPA: T9SS type A sorting domain-containing protein [Ignavibacteria bacterium]|nr:T9SS type A sorting domain-containing protein [Ignavibacteria bacterium]